MQHEPPQRDRATSPDDGGPAFPAQPTHHFEGGLSITAHNGMTLRDYFAAKAMPMLAAEFYSHGQRLSEGSVAELVAPIAYQYADAMLKARTQ